MPEYNLKVNKTPLHGLPVSERIILWVIFQKNVRDNSYKENVAKWCLFESGELSICFVWIYTQKESILMLQRFLGGLIFSQNLAPLNDSNKEIRFNILPFL